MAGDGEQEGTETTEGGERPLAGAALKSALEKERKERKELEQDLKALRKRLDDADAAAEKAKKDAEDASKSEVERLAEQVARLTAERDQERTQREADRLAGERVDRVRRLAGEFADADDVVALLRGRGELDGIESDEDAKAVLDGLKAAKPHLLKRDATASGLEQVLRNGETVTRPDGEKSPERGALTWDELSRMSDEQLEALKKADPERYWTSVGADKQDVTRLRARHVPIRGVYSDPSLTG